MFPLSVRIVLVILCFGASAYLWHEGKSISPLFSVAALCFIYEHFRGGSLGLAFQAYRYQKPQWIRRFLRNTRNPEWLRPSAKSYYYFLTAVVNTADNDLQSARKNFRSAIQCPFTTENMRCVAYCCLVDVDLSLGELDEAKEMFEIARNISHRDELNPIIEKLGKRIEGLA